MQPKIFYTWGETVLQSKFDPGFKKEIEWDIDLLEGYDYEFLKNVAKEKGSHHYKGIINPEIIEKINEWHPEAVLVYGWKFKSHLNVMRHFKNKIPVWFRGDSTLLDEKKNGKNFLKNILLKWVYRHIDIAFYTGTNNKNYFMQNGLKPHQLIKAFHAIDNERFQNINQRYSLPAQEWKAKLKISSNSFVFLYAGKLEQKKGVETLLKAFMKFTNEPIHLVIVGNGPEEETLKNLYGNINNVTFLGFQNQMMMPVVYQLCDAFVLPSIGPGESWGLSMNEAMAAGKAVIASDRCGGAIDLIMNGGNGYIFEAGNADDLFIKMKCLNDKKNDIGKFEEMSLSKIEGFTFQKFVSAIETVMNANG